MLIKDDLIMKSLKFLSLWALPLWLMIWSISNRPEADSLSSFAFTNCPSLACKDTVRVSLDAHCEVHLTPFMLLGGDPACMEGLDVEVFAPNNRSLGSYVPRDYKGQALRYQITNPENGDKCWGHILLQDNTPPLLVCPDHTDEALTTVFANRLTGTLSDEDPAFRRRDFTCWLGPQVPNAGSYFVDTIAFQVAKDGIYTFILMTDFLAAPRGAGAIFQGGFYPENACQNIIAFTESGSIVDNGALLNDWWIRTPGLGDYLPWLNGNTNRPILRISLALKQNETYYLATTSLRPEDTGDFVWLVFRDDIVQAPGIGGILLGESVHTIPWLTPLLCEDFKQLQLSGTQCYRTDNEGNITNISPALRAILQRTGFPHQGDPAFTRNGAVRDNCDHIEVCVTDRLLHEYGDCREVVLVRTFTAKDAHGNTDACEQYITVHKPTTRDVILPNYTAYIECDEMFPTDSTGYPHPSVTGYPTIKTTFGFHDLSEPFCNISAIYADEARVQVCDRAFTFLRVWTIFDWCNPGSTFIYRQLVKVGDFTPPEITCPTGHDGCIPVFSTGPFACAASVIIPPPDTVTDNCSEGWRITVDVILDIYTPIYDLDGEIEDYDYEEVTLATGKKPGDIVNNVPVGVHRFRYRVRDDCKNTGIRDCYFEVIDKSEPIAICKDLLNVSIGGPEPFSKITAEELNNGSYDNCGKIRIEIRRIVDAACAEEYELLTGQTLVTDDTDDPLVPDGDAPLPTDGGLASSDEEEILYTEWGEHIFVICCDVGQTIRVELRVWDDADGNGIAGEYENVDYCGREIEDNYNICWGEIFVEDKIKPLCKPPADRTVRCTDERVRYRPKFTCADEELLNDLFGAFTAADNCHAIIVCQEIIDQRDNCGAGTITRIAYALDDAGNVSAPCRQMITVTLDHDYEIMFPADVSGECNIVLDTIIGLSEAGCDLLTVSVTDERFSVPTGECFKIFRTFRVLNWCEYDGVSPPVVISRDEDCDGKAGDEPVYVLRRPGPGNAQPAFIDRNNNERDNNPRAGEIGSSCPANPAGYWRKSNATGYWQYTQFISVFDSHPPRLLPSPVDVFCSNTLDCEGDIGIPFLVSESCTPGNLRFEVIVELFNDSINFVRVPGDRVRGVYPKYTFESRFPIGNHTVEIFVSDACGNVASFRAPFTVADCKAPALTCINGLAVDLMPVIPAMDVDGDGRPDRGVAQVWAQDFVRSAADDCGEAVRFSINRPGETPDINRRDLILTCQDAGNTVAVEIYAWDDADNPRAIRPDGTRGGPNGARCVTYLLVQENISGTCDDEDAPGAIAAGIVQTPNERPVADVLIQLSEGQHNSAVTDANGRYTAQVPALTTQLLLQADFRTSPLLGVSTYDIVLITQHILGVRPFDSPYQYLAADANRSGSVSILDVLLLRKLILGVEIDFPDEQSWRFVSSAYRFPMPTNPWIEKFPEVLLYRNLQLPLTNADFVAIKLGDVDFNALPDPRRTAPMATKPLLLQIEDRALQAGQTVEIPFRADMNETPGYQFALGFATDALELKDVIYELAGPEHFGWRFIEEGILTTSWNHAAGQAAGGVQTLFRLVFEAKKTGNLQEWLHIEPRYLNAEAYDPTGARRAVEIGFVNSEDQFMLWQNAPNPFAQETTIAFYLPKGGDTTLKIFGSNGQLLYTEKTYFERGHQQWQVGYHRLAGAGVYFYTVEVNGWKATRRMILL